MLALEVVVNGQRISLAGAPELSILSGQVAASKVEMSTPEIHLHVSGITADAHLDWIKQSLKVGDSVTFRLVDVQKADPPAQSLRVPSPAELKRDRR